MTCKGWSTRRDVMRDLVAVSGVRACFDNSVVIGEHPPPRLTCNEVDPEELSSRFGHYNKSDTVEGPDLAGITQMLRAIDQYDELSERKADPVQTNNSSGKHTIIVISKLNPAASEFVPRDVEINQNKNLQSEDNKIEVKNDSGMSKRKDAVLGVEKNKTSDNETELVKDNKNKNLHTNLSDDNILKNTKSDDKENMENNKTYNSDSNQLNSVSSNAKVTKESKKEIIEKREKLRKIVSDTSNTNCVTVKRKRNIAIQALLKLYSSPTKQSNPDPVTLLPPAYYQSSLKYPSGEKEKEEGNLKQHHDTGHAMDLVDLSNLNVQKDEIVVDKLKQHYTVQDDNTMKQHHDIPIAMDLVVLDENPSDIKPVQNEFYTEITSNVVIPVTSDCMSIDNTKETSKTETIEVDEDYKESVEKVTRWLNSVDTKDNVKETDNKKVIEKKVKPKMPKAPFVGPIIFRKKEMKTISPSVSDSEAKTSASPVSSTVFVPTKYAEALKKNYAERANAKKSQEEDMWTKVQNQLKEKEKNMNGEA